VGDVVILPRIVLLPRSDDSRIVIQPLSTSLFTLQIPDVSDRLAVSFSAQTSDYSVAAVSVHSSGTLAADFSFDVEWIGAGSCFITFTAACNCSANGSTALLFVQSLPLVVAVPNSIDIFNPQSNVSINITLPQPIDHSVVINLRPNVPFAFLISPATITVTPAAMVQSVTLSYGSPGRYSVIASSPYPGALQGLLLPVASVVARPMLLAEEFNVVIPHRGTHIMVFRQLAVPVDAPITITIVPSSSSESQQPAMSLSATRFVILPASSNDVMRVSITSTVDYWASGAAAAIRFSVAAPASSIYSGAQGVSAIVRLLPRIEFPSVVHVPLFGRAVIAVTAVRSHVPADSMTAAIEGNSDVIMLQPSRVTADIDGTTIHVAIRCTPNPASARSVYVRITGGLLDGAAVGPIAVMCKRRSITATVDTLSIAQYSTATFYLRCDVPPDADVTVTLKLSRDGCAALDKSSVLIPARSDVASAYAVTVTHLQPCAVTLQMQSFSFYGNYAPDGSPDAPQPLALALSGTVTVSPAHLSLTRGQTSSLSLTLNPPADAPLFIAFNISNSSGAGSNMSACASLDPPFFVVAAGQGGPFAFAARHAAVGQCTVDVHIAVRSSSMYSGFSRARAFALVALSYVEINGDVPLRVRGGGRGAEFPVRILAMASDFDRETTFNVSFTAGKGLTLSPPFMIITSAAPLASPPPQLSVMLSGEAGTKPLSPDEFSFRVDVARIGGGDASAPSTFTVHRLPFVSMPPTPVLLPIGASYAIPIQLSRPSTSPVILKAAISALSNLSAACNGVTFSRFAVTFEPNAINPSSSITISISREVSCVVSWSVASADVSFSAAALPDMTIRALLPLNVSSTTALVSRGRKTHFAIACPFESGHACAMAMDSAVTPVLSSSDVSAELRAVPAALAHDSGPNWASGGALLVVTASQRAAQGAGALLCCKAAAAPLALGASPLWTHGVCVRVWVAPDLGLKGGGSCFVGNFVSVAADFGVQPAVVDRVQFFVQQGSGVRVEANGSSARVTCLSAGSHLIQACTYPIPDAPSAAACAVAPVSVVCAPRPLQRQVPPMFAGSVVVGTSSLGLSAAFSARSLVVLIGSSASVILSLSVHPPPPSLSLVASSAQLVATAAAPSETESGGAALAVDIVCLDLPNPSPARGAAVLAAIDTASGSPGIVLDEVQVCTCGACVAPSVIRCCRSRAPLL
jgi:hypothetical protein